MTCSSWVLVQKGAFSMGNTRNDPEGWDLELPVHTVHIDYDFQMNPFLVTFEEYDDYCAATGTLPLDDLHPRIGYRTGKGKKPVTSIEWWDAIRYCNWKSAQEGLSPAYDEEGNLLDARGSRSKNISRVVGYRIPTEAEWEYTAKGGHMMQRDTRYSGSNDLERVGWYWKNSGENKLTGSEKKWHPKKVLQNRGMPQPVGTKQPNVLGVYDLSGNSWEWCYDWFGLYSHDTLHNPIGPIDGSQRVLRGGSWLLQADKCRVSHRHYESARCPIASPGLRLVRTVFL